VLDNGTRLRKNPFMSAMCQKRGVSFAKMTSGLKPFAINNIPKLQNDAE
jgi:hypothetical protein